MHRFHSDEPMSELGGIGTPKELGRKQDEGKAEVVMVGQEQLHRHEQEEQEQEQAVEFVGEPGESHLFRLGNDRLKYPGK